MNERERTKAGLEFLKLRWDDIDFDHTAQAEGGERPAIQKAVAANALLVDLPAPDAREISGCTVFDAVLGRKSQRKYSAASLSLADLAWLLFATQGLRVPGPPHSRRTVPSAGARHAFESYIYVDRVEGLAKGLYRYLPLDHQLVLEQTYQAGMETQLDEAVFGQFWQSAAFFIWTAVPWRMEWRYSFAAAKLLAIDVGHVCQNLYLACEAIAAGTCGIGAYDQKLVDTFVGVDGETEFALYMAPVGKLTSAADT